MKLRAWAAPAVAVLTAVSLSGCSSLTPGTAAVVGDQRITMQQVDDLVHAQCQGAEAAKRAGQSQATPLSDIRRRSLGLLIDTALSEQYAASEGVAPAPQITNLIYSNYQKALAQYPAPARKTLDSAFQELAASQSGLIAVAAHQKGETISESNAEGLLNQGVAGRRAWQKSVHITTDPRFAPDKEGFPGGGDGSVSRASSSFARGGAASQPSPAWIDQLPSSQKCG